MDQMKLFVYGDFGAMALEKSLITVWENSADVSEVVRISRLPPPKTSNVVERITRRFSPSLSSKIRSHNDEVLRVVREGYHHNSVVLIFKGMELHPNTLRQIKSMNIRLFCYNPDHPYVYSGPGSGSVFMRKSLSLYDVYFTYAKDALLDLIADGVQAELIPFGYETDALSEPFIRDSQEIQRACFIGTPNSQRVEFFKAIEGKIPVDLYGNGWDLWFSDSEFLTTYGPVFDEHHWKTMARYRLQFNLMAQHNMNTHNMRTFAAPASGSIMIAPYNDDHSSFFINEKEVFLFRNTDHAIELAHHVLGMSYQEAFNIRRAARRRCIESGYAYAARSQQMLKTMLINSKGLES